MTLPAGPRLLRLAATCALAIGQALPALAQPAAQPASPQPLSRPPPSAPVPRPPSGAAPAAESGLRWQQLTPAQRESLKPLEREWSGIDASRKQKWIELSSRVPSMSEAERARIQTRMADWAKLTPLERGRARLNFEEAKGLSSQDRQARWEAYQALPPEQKRQFAERAAPPVPRPPSGPPGARADMAAERNGTHSLPQAKSNIGPNPAFATPPRPVAPTVMQASPGATTTLITKRPVPPPHQQTGLPKIVASPEFVDRSTLLPQRGPQGAATRPVPPADAASVARGRR